MSADGLGAACPLSGPVEAINDGQRADLAELAIDQAGGDVDGKRIAVLGARFQARHRRYPQLPRADRGRPSARPRCRRTDL